MVEKPADTEGMSTRARATPSDVPPVRSDDLSDDESDDDVSEPDEDLTSQATDDTQVVSDLHVQGMGMFDDTRCLVNLSQKVKGHKIYCGHPREICPRRKYQELQTVSGRRGTEGYYQQLPNSKGTVNDAVADTFLTPQAWVETRQSNL
jgi:hypothetical protein